MPCVMSHAFIDPATRAARGLPENLIRLCVGIEDPTDLIDDWQHALLAACAITYAADNFIRLPNPISCAVEKLAFNELHTNASRPREDREWFFSTPGKVILFGEHTVVHGITAITVSLTDTGDYVHEWDLDGLAWDTVTPVLPGEHHADQLDQKLMEAIAARGAHSASVVFLYLYITMAHGGERLSFSFTARPTLPISAGLGPSASYSACIATALLLPHQQIKIPPLLAPMRPVGADDPGHLHMSHQGRHAISPDTAEEVNRWAFVAEKVLHGNPSSVDNSVAVFGGALAYTWPGFGKKSGMEQIQGFRPLRFLLVDSRVPRDTKKPVANVAMKKAEEPEAVNKIMGAIQAISNEDISACHSFASITSPESCLL
ncbi:ribosomal protein S5 domain 2-type protein [Rhodofomes roseus]|uniref:Ribosomal protein S5 domain 2-type protein n=1 Tax=Rhodofomes roseus TaxID=34475 RepID=A0ABQ8JX64_9APHY|nr:ribosomal protein S5 domain 2-type protein [Rhodofomes roseus]KAH9828648.1 ribosomal protein S5 domain 2-type protein [Rhodofomes roseus]